MATTDTILNFIECIQFKNNGKGQLKFAYQISNQFTYDIPLTLAQKQSPLDRFGGERWKFNEI